MLKKAALILALASPAAAQSNLLCSDWGNVAYETAYLDLRSGFIRSGCEQNPSDCPPAQHAAFEAATEVLKDKRGVMVLTRDTAVDTAPETPHWTPQPKGWAERYITGLTTFIRPPVDMDNEEGHLELASRLGDCVYEHCQELLYGELFTCEGIPFYPDPDESDSEAFMAQFARRGEAAKEAADRYWRRFED